MDRRTLLRWFAFLCGSSASGCLLAPPHAPTGQVPPMPLGLLPFLDPAPYQVPFVDPKTGMMTDAWQRYHINLERVIFGVWKDVPYDAANFTTGFPVTGATTWNVSALNVNQLEYFQMGNFAAVFFTLLNTTVSADVNPLVITIPTLRQKADSTFKIYRNTIAIQISPATYVPGVCDVGNVPTEQPVRLVMSPYTGTNFPVASPSINVTGLVIFECVSVATP